MKFVKSCQTDIEILYVFQQHVRAYAYNLISGVRLQMNLGDRMAETFF